MTRETMEFRLDTAPLLAGLERLRRAAAADGDLSNRLLSAMARAFVSLARRAFREPSLQIPSPWPGYKTLADGLPAPHARRKLAAGRTTMLIDTGTLVGSIIAGDPSGGQIEIRSAAPYAIYHHTGTKNMPMRRFFPIAESETELTTAGREALRGALEAAASAWKL